MPIRLAIVGCGQIASAHTRAAVSLGREICEVVAVCDVEQQRACDFVNQYASGAGVYPELAPLLKESEPNMVVVCTPPATHMLLARQCIESGVAVLCEKPLAIDTPTAQSVVGYAEALGVVLRTSVKFRFVEGVLYAKNCLESGILGRLNRVEIAFGGVLERKDSWHWNPEQSGGGVLMDNGPHAIDLARFLLGDVRIAQVDFRYRNQVRVEDEVSLLLASDICSIIRIELSWRRNLGQTFLRIIGECGTLEVRFDATVWRSENCIHAEAEQIVTAGYNKEQAFARQMAAFFAELTSPNPFLWRSDDGVRAVEIINAAYHMV